MKLRIENRRDFWSGMMFAGFGATFATLSLEYDLGTLRQMGPGWFPFALGLVLTVLGILIVFGAARSRPRDEGKDHEIKPVGWRELFLVLLSIAIFALLLPYLGVIVAIVLMVLTSALAGHEKRPLEVAIVAIALSFACYAIFIYGLGVPLPVWPIFLGG
ncbi:tripartite tricarboxylate transporter TctB family protein [Rhizobium sp.]|uniref:tripartite tricarboxylate transporter TctB family protein n=1 Tax=Rhizobium sp. TaxID=391 RepID=UPI00289B30DC